MIKAVRHVGIVVTDIKKSLYFYRDLLGLKVKIDAMEQGKFIDDISDLKNVKVRVVKMSADNDGLVELLLYKSHPGKPHKAKRICTTGVSHVAFTIKDIDREYKKLKEKGVKFHCPPQISPNHKAKVAFCRDYEGNLIELVEELN